MGLSTPVGGGIGLAVSLIAIVAAGGGLGIVWAAPEGSDGGDGAPSSRTQPGSVQSQAGPAPQSGVPFIGPHPGQLNAHAEQQFLAPSDLSAQSGSTPEDQQCSAEQCAVNCPVGSSAQIRAAVMEPDSCA